MSPPTDGGGSGRIAGHPERTVPDFIRSGPVPAGGPPSTTSEQAVPAAE
ncbi:hypothetical protein OG345_38085 [Streptomyces sp. NBC_01220]|nr:hypothetical protein OG345_38085 [Streptomyces sp. NBC_01220]